jgi:hypothetical protein
MTQEVLAPITQASFRCQHNYDKLKHTLEEILCSTWNCTMLNAALMTCRKSKHSTGLETKEKPGQQHRGAE